MKRLPRPLDPVEIRVLGSLLEKETTTPDQYPLTVPALVAACNQKTNRDPVLELAPREVEDALARLKSDVFVWPATGARAVRWRVSLDRRWTLTPATRAVMALLLLRGPQTAGELRSRSDRLHDFPTVLAVEAALESLAGGNEPLVVRLPRRPGQKEERWMHRVGGPVDLETLGEETAPELAAPRRSLLDDRLSAIEARLAKIEAALGLE
jgi:uncharacterized protein YceH (UPF0502 family)